VSSVIEKILPGKAISLSLWPEYLDEGSLKYPDEALEQVRKELLRELSLTRQMFSDAQELILSYGTGKRRDIHYVEMVVDNLQSEIARYLNRLSSSALSGKASRRLFTFSVVVDDIERIGDRAVNLATLARYKYEDKADFSSEAEVELEEISKLVFENLKDTATVMRQGHLHLIEDISERDTFIHTKIEDALQNHLMRFRMRTCEAEAGPLFVDVLINLKRISDLCKNIARNFENFE
jgi:phosphate:Na+ symporter